MASFSAGRTLIGKLYRLDVPSGNGVLASLICEIKRSKRAETAAAARDFIYLMDSKYTDRRALE
jgi:hypothetical protein